MHDVELHFPLQELEATLKAALSETATKLGQGNVPLMLHIKYTAIEPLFEEEF